MEFKKMAIGDQIYGTGIDMDVSLWKVQNVNFVDPHFDSHLKDTSHPNNQNIKNFLTHLAICHTVIIDKFEHQVPIYNASSPDELALVNAAYQLGYSFVGWNESNVITI